MKLSCLNVVIAGSLFLAGGLRFACAGAFLPQPGEGVAIVQTSFQNANKGWDRRGRLLPIRNWGTTEIDAYAEYGLREELTVVSETNWHNFHTAKLYDQNGLETGRSQQTGIGATLFGLRAKALEWSNGGDVISVQASGRFFNGPRDAAIYSDTRSKVQGEIRLLYGHSMTHWGLPIFYDQQIAFRTNGPGGHQLRIESTIGVRPLPRLMILLQQFSTTTLAPFGRGGALANAAQVSVVLDVVANFSAQVGYRYGLRGFESARGQGIVFGLWTRF